MRRHELELKSYLKAKLTNLKEDILQGHQKYATKRLLAIKATVECGAQQWTVKVFGKVQGEDTEMLHFFEKVKISFEGVGFQPIEWVKNRMPTTANMNGVQITRPFTTEQPFRVKFAFDLETSPKRFALSP